MSRSNRKDPADHKAAADRKGAPHEDRKAAADRKGPPYEDHTKPLTALKAGEQGRVVDVLRDPNGRADKLAALGVTPGARIRVLQTFPGIVFECDQTELAVERNVARVIMVDTDSGRDEPARRRSAAGRAR